MLLELWAKFSQKEKFNKKLQKELGSQYNTQNYLEQMNHICDDVDQLLKKAKLTKQDILALVLYTSWSFEVVKQTKAELDETFNITLNTSPKYEELDKFNKAIRSFIIAHPLDTTKPAQYLTFKVLKNTPNKNKTYVYFKVYNTTKNNQDSSFQKYFGLSLDDLVICIKECIKTLDYFNKVLKRKVR